MANSANSSVEQAPGIAFHLGKYEKPVLEELERMSAEGAMSKIWRKDSKWWTGSGEGEWLGWLDIVEQQLAQTDSFSKFADEVKARGFKHALLLGMGGSSLCVEVMRMTFGTRGGFPDMIVVDSTVPAQVLDARKRVDMKNTLVIVASKSGGTTEPNVLCQYFFEEAKKELADQAGQNFVAITDPGSSLEKTAKELKFKWTFYGVPSIGGRFSALSNFGMIPSAAMGYDVKEFLTHAASMVSLCAAAQPVEKNPGAVLGTIMGVLAKQGRDKVTIITSPPANSLGAWLEQLIAESTGKQGKGVVPIADEKLCPPDEYGADRLFVYVRVANGLDSKQEAAIDSFIKAGHPVVVVNMKDKVELGGEFFRFEFATAVAGHVIGINPFDQPNVQESKDYTKQLLSEYLSKGKFDDEAPLAQDAGLKLYVDAANKARLENAVGTGKSVREYLAAHLKSLRPGDYCAFNSYVERDDETIELLQQPRTAVLEARKVATTLGFGPRFLHSTGQLHKGGPNSGVFIQITSDDKQDVPVPGEKFTFGVLKQAQALGDYLALSKRDRRLVRLHLPADTRAGLKALSEMIRSIAGEIR